MRTVIAVIGVAAAVCIQTAAWSNGGQSASASSPKFGTHDYIAFQGYVLSGKPTFIKQNLNAFFIGTEAPDFGKALMPTAMGTYKDTAACHCILFAANGDITNDRLELRVQQEFDKANDALSHGNKRLAAFYAGAMAHYLGDLSQFCHIMGAQSHWGTETHQVHSTYENVVDDTMKWQTQSSSLLDPFIQNVNVAGTTAGAIAVSVARFTETGTDNRNPQWMHTRFAALMAAHKSSPTKWDAGFKEQTGLNVNRSINGVKKTLGMLED